MNRRPYSESTQKCGLTCPVTNPSSDLRRPWAGPREDDLAAVVESSDSQEPTLRQELGMPAVGRGHGSGSGYGRNSASRHVIARWSGGGTGNGNRNVKQRRPFRAVIPSVRVLLASIGKALVRVAPLCLALVGSVALAVGILEVHSFMITSPRFMIREILVNGNERLDDNEIRRLAGVAVGTSIFSMCLGRVEAAVAASPWIATVRARRRLPAQVVVEVTERKPVALVVLDGSSYLADGEGRLFKRANIQVGDADGLVVITGLDRQSYVTAPDVVERAVWLVLQAVAQFQASTRRPAIGEASFGRGGLTLYTEETGTAIRIGRTALALPLDLSRELARFDLVWAALSLEERGFARTVHLDNSTRSDRVTVRLADRLANKLANKR
ncbi:MAG: FtsQ-type POTRA domain-containing protein [Pseudomonadota bacterium]